MATRIIKLQNDSYTLLPVTDAKLVQMTVDGNTKSVYDVILEDEEVTAAGYNELNDRVETIETAGYITNAALSPLSEAISTLQTTGIKLYGTTTKGPASNAAYTNGLTYIYSNGTTTYTIPAALSISGEAEVLESGDMFTYLETAKKWMVMDNNKDIATNNIAGTIKLYNAKRSSAVTTNSATSESGKYYAIELDSNNKAFVNIPWINNVVTYTFGVANDYIDGGLDGESWRLYACTCTNGTLSGAIAEMNAGKIVIANVGTGNGFVLQKFGGESGESVFLESLNQNAEFEWTSSTGGSIKFYYSNIAHLNDIPDVASGQWLDTEFVLPSDGNTIEMYNYLDGEVENTVSLQHGAPTADANSKLSKDASGGSAIAANTATQIVTGVDISRDANGHVTGLDLDSKSITIPSIPNGFANVKTDSDETDITENTTKGTVAADSTTDTVTLRGGNKWITTGVNTTSDIAYVNHKTWKTADGSIVANASGATAAWSIDVVKGVTLSYDAAGHVTGLSVTSGKIPANPNTDIKVNEWGKDDNNGYPVLFSYTASNASKTSATNSFVASDTDGTTNFYYNPSTNTLKATYITSTNVTATKHITSGGTASQFVTGTGTLQSISGLYAANMTIDTSANYIKEPEFKTVKINGSSTNAASTYNCVLQYDTTNKCLNFVFN